MKYLPRGTWIIVNLLSQEKSAGGIHIPDAVYGRENRLAKVEAVGPGQRYMDGTVWPMDVVPGDVVFVGLPERKEERDRRYIGNRSDNRLLVMDEEVIAKVVDFDVKVEIQA